VCVCVCVCGKMTSGAGEIVSEYPISLDEWTTISAERNRNDGSLIVNDAPAVKGPNHSSCVFASHFIQFLSSRHQWRTQDFVFFWGGGQI